MEDINIEFYKDNAALIEYLKQNAPHDCVEKIYDKNSLIIDEYEKSATLYYVVDGVISVEILNEDKRYISSFIFKMTSLV